MKVYILTGGYEHEGDEVVSAHSTKELAEVAMKEFKEHKGIDSISFHHMNIEEHEVEDEKD